MTRVTTGGSISATAVIASVVGAGAVVAGVVAGTASFSGVAAISPLMSGIVTATPNSVFAAMLVGESVGTRLDASVTSGVPSGGVDCTSTNTCQGGSGTCCKGSTRRTMNASTTCTVKGVARGVSGTETCSGSGSCALGTCTGTCSIAGAQLVSQDGATVSCSANDDYGCTRVAAGSNGATVASLTQISVVALGKIVAPTTTLDIHRAGGGTSRFACTGNTGTTLLTGCSCSSNCTGTLATNDKVEDDNVRPAGIHVAHVPSLGNAIDCTENSSDQRTFWQWGTQSTDPACLNGLCSNVAGTDVNGDPGVSGHWAFSVMTWTSTTGPHDYLHFFGAADVNSTCSQNKLLEDWQWAGSDASTTPLIFARTCGVAVCPAGDIGGDNRRTGSSAGATTITQNSTAHFITVEVFTRNTATGTACTNDDNGAVSCGSSTKKNTVNAWIDGTQVLSSVVIQTWSNGFDVNGFHFGGGSASHYFVSHACGAADNGSGNDPVADSEACAF